MRTVGLVLLLFSCICCGRSKQDEDSEREELGPDPSPYLDSCDDPSSCSRPTNLNCPDVVIELNDDLLELSPEEPEDSSTQLARTPELNFLSNLYEGFSSGISTVYRSADSAKTRIYSKISDATLDFADKVRTILREEFWDLIANGIADVFNTATAPGNSFLLFLS